MSSDYELDAQLLQAAGMAQAREERLDIAELGRELGAEADSLRQRVNRLHSLGLMLAGLEEELPPILMTAGQQYLQLNGKVDDEVLWFLPMAIDDLHTREALLRGGTMLIDQFRGAILNGEGGQHAAELVPPAFATAVDDALALDLFAAAVALLARLSSGDPAGCVAEEIMAVALMNDAESWLEMRADNQEISKDEARSAINELRGLFELFQDDDVLDMFDMAEPADAALAGHNPINRMTGVADQRVEAWFDPFGGIAPTGHLDERPLKT